MGYRNTILFILIVATGLFALWFSKADELTYRPVSKPEGYRELVLQKRSSRQVNFLTGLPRSEVESGADLPDSAGLQVCDALYRDPVSPTAGSAQSLLTIVEFFDYRCPYCKVLTQILADILGSDARVRVIFKDWPILSKTSELAARAALAADKQQKYEAFHRRIMKAGLIPTQGYIEDVAKRLGMDIARLRNDMAADETTRALRRNSRLASALGLIGTPALVVGRTIVQGGISRAQLDRLIEIELETKQSGPCRPS
ncbi:MAG: DsbA family protein [Alphaproteobacteria bacterium]